jgi:hypothetical protein
MMLLEYDSLSMVIVVSYQKVILSQDSVVKFSSSKAESFATASPSPLRGSSRTKDTEN